MMSLTTTSWSEATTPHADDLDRRSPESNIPRLRKSKQNMPCKTYCKTCNLPCAVGQCLGLVYVHWIHSDVNSHSNQFRDLSWEWYGKLIGRGFPLWGVMKSAAWIGGTQESQECTWWLLDDEKWWLTAPNFDSQASLFSPQNMCPSIGEKQLQGHATWKVIGSSWNHFTTIQ